MKQQPGLGQTEAEEEVQRIYSEAWNLIEEKQATCLWFFDPTYKPTDGAGIARAMRLIERYGNCEDYKRARKIREWLSQNSSALSAD